MEAPERPESVKKPESVKGAPHPSLPLQYFWYRVMPN